MECSFKNFLDGRENNMWKNMDVDNSELTSSLRSINSVWEEALEVSTQFNVLIYSFLLMHKSKKWFKNL